MAAPVALLLVGRGPGGLGFVWDLAMGLGFAALTVMGAQFGLSARFRRASAPFGIDVIYYFHRWMGIGALAFLAAHYVLIRFSAPEALAGILPWEAPWHMTAGRLALLAFLLVVVTSVWRKPLHIEYDHWRMIHAALSVLGMGLALWHILGAGYYSGTAWRKAAWGMFVSLWLLLVGYIRLVKPWRLAGRPWTLTDVRPEASGVWTLRLMPDGHRGLTFQPGQFAWLSLGISPFLAREHPFSFSGSAESGPEVSFTIKELGDFTRTVGRTPLGTTAFVDGPHGSFTVDRHPKAPGFGFVAGGVGIAPVISMLRTLADRGDRRPLALIYGTDTVEEALFQEELTALGERLDLRVVHVVLRAPGGWEGPTGYVTEELVGEVFPPGDARWVHFLCGPKPMSDTAIRGLRANRVPLRRIHFELFDMV